MFSNYNNDIILAVILGTIVFFVLLSFSISYYIIYQRKRREHQLEINNFREQFEDQLLKARVEVQEQTFQQIGKELHDNVCQLLGSSRVLLWLAEKKLTSPPDVMLKANESIGEAIQEIRELSRSLDKDWLERFSFADNLYREIERINDSFSQPLKANFSGPDSGFLTSSEQLILFRIVQEAIQNALKHAFPTRIDIFTVTNLNSFTIIVEDNGKGYPENIKAGMGVINMKHRCRLLGGEIYWEKREVTGTRVRITIPPKKKQHEDTDRIGG